MLGFAKNIKQFRNAFAKLHGPDGKLFIIS